MILSRSEGSILKTWCSSALFIPHRMIGSLRDFYLPLSLMPIRDSVAEPTPLPFYGDVAGGFMITSFSLAPIFGWVQGLQSLIKGWTGDRVLLPS